MAAIVPDTPRIVPGLPVTAPAILAMVVRRLILPAIVRLIVLPPRLFLQIRAIAPMPRTIPARDRAGGNRVLCRQIRATDRMPQTIPPRDRAEERRVLCRQIRAIDRMPQTILERDRAEERRVLCRQIRGTVRTQPRAHDPAQMKPAVINARRPLTLGLRKLIVRTHFPEPWEGVRRAHAGTKVWQPREARHVASVASSRETRVESFNSGKV